ncbi:MAG: class I SAM-dependent methyltransferase [Desulfobacteraceae bacterium]|nr:class I SAM-dependent methyltransferase [Desulfobacteraceae bacterium]MBC2757703.1 class I SAM-dependent methyltransferase [Desulfobacteraceae bacterium]
MENYYQTNFKAYHKRTFSVDPALFLNPFVNNLPQKASVLDIGCGSGRDLLWLKNQGFQVTGFEQSPGLADLAAKHAACEVIEGDFETFDFTPFSFDAILASGSLVHVPHNRLPQVLGNIKLSLNQNGIFYISLKQGESFRTDQTQRIFYLWQGTELKEIFSALNLDIIHLSNTESVMNSKDLWLGYVLKRKL